MTTEMIGGSHVGQQSCLNSKAFQSRSGQSHQGPTSMGVQSSGHGRGQTRRVFGDEVKRTQRQISDPNSQGSVLGLGLAQLLEQHPSLSDGHRRAWRNLAQWNGEGVAG